MQSTLAIQEASLGDTWPQLALLFFLFLLFFAATLGYGSLLRGRAGGSYLNRLSDSFLFGSLALYFSAFTLASLHLLSIFPAWLWAVLFVPGLAAFVPLSRAALGTRARFGAGLFLFVFLLRALSAAQPSQHGDPLLYHLLGPRLWVEAGGFLMHPNLPNALLASTWECLYVWPQLFWLTRDPVFGLVEAQIFSQWLHLFLAWGGCALLVMRLFRGSVRDSWLPIAGLAAIFVAGVQWTAPLAKNDVGIAFWILGAFIFFLEGLKENRAKNIALSGVFAGLAVAGKITALLSLAPVLGLLLIVLRNKASVRAALFWLGGFLVGAVPLCTRNYLLSSDPFFPLFPKLFPSPWVSKSWGAHFAQVAPSSPLHSLGHAFTRAPQLIGESPWIQGAVLVLLLALLARAWAQKAFGELVSKEKLALTLGALAAYLIFTITQAPEIELRYLGATLMLMAASGACAFLRFAEHFRKEKQRKVAAFVVLAATLAISKLPLHILRKIWFEPLGVAYIRTHSGGEAKAWLRQQGGFVIVAGDNETYYLTPLGVAVLTERPDLDAINSEGNAFPPYMRDLCAASHARYLLDVRPDNPNGFERRFGAAALAPGKVFSAQGSNVYDLRRYDPQCR